MNYTLSEFACVTIRDWLKSFAGFGTARPEVLIYSEGVEIPRQAIVIQATGNDSERVQVEVSLLLDQADFTDAAHREAAAMVRLVLCPPAPRYQPGTTAITCHPDFEVFANQSAGRVFDLVDPSETHNAQDGRLIYLLAFSAVVMLA